MPDSLIHIIEEPDPYAMSLSFGSTQDNHFQLRMGKGQQDPNRKWHCKSIPTGNYDVVIKGEEESQQSDEDEVFEEELEAQRFRVKKIKEKLDMINNDLE